MLEVSEATQQEIRDIGASKGHLCTRCKRNDSKELSDLFKCANEERTYEYVDLTTLPGAQTVVILQCKYFQPKEV